ncbi:peroxiredoxin family protein [Pedobacter hiemivivus]|uniref:AhpC/TSA family protein n=1 Tax=Pedobacter hiemivivus TaxID=2530454 RepID=A0A4R0NA24_9SPHI|nr:TlpA disulfide reductase family protein [Pedobacter hiemivivus]TCC97079.1 AhpC/TSA family protein [Pedobacter hiemivivus]
MKKTTLTITLLGAFFALHAQNYTIKGNLVGQGNEKIIVKGIEGAITVEAKNDVFELTGPAGEEPFVTSVSTGIDRNLYLGGGKTGMYQPPLPLEIVLTKGAKLTITGAALDLNLASVTGDAFNDSFTQFRKAEEPLIKQMAALQKQMVESRIMGVKDAMAEIAPKMLENRKAISASRKKFIKEHPEAFASVYYLSMTARDYNTAELEAAYNGLASTYKNTRYAKGIVAKIESVKIIQAGGPAPDFTKPGVDGKPVSLSQFRGKYVLLDFWGSWCAPCRAANPHLKELYTTYSAKGFEILGIASEKVSGQTQAEKVWKEAIEKDGLTWTNVLNNEVSMKQDLVQLYGIEAYPTQILLDKEGKIVARWTGAAGKQLDDKLKAIFNN